MGRESHPLNTNLIKKNNVSMLSKELSNQEDSTYCDITSSTEGYPTIKAHHRTLKYRLKICRVQKSKLTLEIPLFDLLQGI